ncbi:MAG: hypothetical protein GTO61_14555, partial [Gemmatimonadales bacterium]|nr:hypothetical protein [Gemmatimonadales bacterium]
MSSLPIIISAFMLLAPQEAGLRVSDASNCTQLENVYYCGGASPAAFLVVRVVDPGAGKFVT